MSDTSRVYAHSGKILYQVDTVTLAANEIGPLTGLVGSESLTDLAVDKADNMVGVSFNNLYKINATTAAVTLVGDIKIGGNMAGFTSLSFVPNSAGGDDILVSANGQGDVYKITQTPTVSTTKIGNFGTRGSDQIVSSGDLFGVAGFGIYATVKVGTDPNDYLVKVDPVTFKATLPANDTGYSKIFGIGFWAGKVYGFVDMGVDSGKIVEIDPTTGVGQELFMSPVEWFGAGVATDAPIIQ